MVKINFDSLSAETESISGNTKIQMIMNMNYVFGWLARQSFVPSNKCVYEWITNYSVPSNFNRSLRVFAPLARTKYILCARATAMATNE